jgi:hypothetical protein
LFNAAAYDEEKNGKFTTLLSDINFQLPHIVRRLQPSSSIPITSKPSGLILNEQLDACFLATTDPMDIEHTLDVGKGCQRAVSSLFKP